MTPHDMEDHLIMSTITITWENGSYEVEQDNEYIGDFTDLHAVCKFALAVAGECPEFTTVILESVE